MSSDAKPSNTKSDNQIQREQTHGGDGDSGGTTTATVYPKAPQRLQDTFTDERNDVLTVINELEDQLDRQQEIREALERELTSTNENLQDANQRNQELEWQTVTLQTRVDALEQLKQEVSALEEELTDANTRAQRINDQFIEADKDRARFKNELKAANKQLDELWTVRKERDGLRTECRNLSMKVEELERVQRDLVEQRSQLQLQTQDLQADLEGIQTDRSKLEELTRQQTDRVRELGQIQESLAEKVEALRTEKKNIQVQIAHLERENSRLAEQRQFYEGEVTTLRSQNRTAEAALTSVKKAFSEVRVALTETRARARRRVVDTWPRVGSPLEGVIPPTHGKLDQEPAAATAGSSSKADNTTKSES